MTEALNPLTLAVTTRALDLLQMRQSYIAQNIANASTPGYRPVAFEFEDALRSAAATGRIDAVETVSGNLIEHAEGGTVRLDLELAEATQTALRFSALIEMLGRQFALQRQISSNTGR